MSAKHTPEPWFTLTGSKGPVIIAEHEPNDWTEFADVKRHIDAARIVACVNACEGINPDSVPDMLDVLRMVKACELKHDENGHAYLKVPARSLDDVGAYVSAVIVKAGGNSAGIQKGNNSEPPKFSNYHEDEALLSRDW